jgi:hypothetical protein
LPNPNLGPYINSPTVNRIPNIGSPVIDNGDTITYTTLYPSFVTDQIGQPRIINGIIDIGYIEVGIICYTGDSKVFVKDSITREEKYIKVKEIDKNIHLVNDMINNTFIPFVSCIITINTNRIYKIPKDFFEIDKPNYDLLISGGHKIFINGNDIKVKNIPNIKKVKIKKQPLYYICTGTENRNTININNIPLLTWSRDEWLLKKKQYQMINFDILFTIIT